MEHPAKFSEPILDVIRARLHERLSPDARILDPFAGVGGVHELGYDSVGVEIEPEWAACHGRTICGDSTRLTELFGDQPFDAVVTSPAYGNRLADRYAGDGTRRFTYRIALGRDLTEHNLGGLQWGDRYREFHRLVWKQCLAVLKPGGLMIVNVSNHIRAHQEQPVVEWHIGCLIEVGLFIDQVDQVKTMRIGYGANRDVRVGGEAVIVARTPV